MRALFIFLSSLMMMVVVATASAQEAGLCNPGWIRTASGSAARLLILQGADVNQFCDTNRNRPLHQALGIDQAGLGLIRALVTAGANLTAENLQGQSAVEHASDRFDRLRTRFSLGSAAYRREKAIYQLVSRRPGADRAARVPRQVESVFRECDACPEMVVMPGGRLALGRFEVTVGEYGAFASATRAGAGGGCRVPPPRRRSVAVMARARRPGPVERLAMRLGVGFPTAPARRPGPDREDRAVRIVPDASAAWRNPGFSQTSRHPVVCVSWYDVQQYISWLSRTTGATYRLPTEGEWGSAAGGSGCQRPDRFRPCPGWDGTIFTAPVGSNGSNGVGLSNMEGNVWEWTEGCWEGDCGRRVVRGSSSSLNAADVGPRARYGVRAGSRLGLGGFRVARTLD